MEACCVRWWSCEPDRAPGDLRNLLPRRGNLEVENNVWLVGDEREVMLIDPAHDAEAVAKQVGDRR